MTEPKTLPPSLRIWAQHRVGEIIRVRDASQPQPNSQVWELHSTADARHFIKISPSATFYRRETFAYRHAVPALLRNRAPQLVDSRAEALALLLTAVPGSPVTQLRLVDAGQRAVHRQAGALYARLHEAGGLDREARSEAEYVLTATANGVGKHLAAAADRLTAAERELVLCYAVQLRTAGPVPLGFIQGDAQERNWLWESRSGLAVIDFERAQFAPLVKDFVILAATAWLEAPALERAFFHGYGRQLTGQERHVLQCLVVLDAVSCLAWGPPHGDDEVTARGQRTLDRLMRRDHP
jgi:Ser/Thr protein kinase RdoA (MazF antagonist)